MPFKEKEDWLGGLDSNQDNQLQRLMYYRLYDLPAAGLGSLRYFAAREKASSGRAETAQKKKRARETDWCLRAGVPKSHARIEYSGKKRTGEIAQMNTARRSIRSVLFGVALLAPALGA